MDANDSLKVIQNEDNTFTLEWDKNDPKWSFLNGMTSKEISAIIEQAVKDDKYNDF
jgi:hypothetical protein|tara:strand:+ start:358 stop:525 length:168 start_codon:yes stop_codon:yes gene_type:complete